MADNTTTTSTTQQQQAERQARIERVKRDLAWAIEQTMRDIRALEAYIAEHKEQSKPQQRDGGDA